MAAARSRSAVVRGDVDSYPGNRPLSLDFETARWSTGITGLPLNRKPNATTTALLIAYERADATSALGGSDQAIHEAWRGLDQAKRNYENSEISVKLSERRVERQICGPTWHHRARFGGCRKDLIGARTNAPRPDSPHPGASQFWRDIESFHQRRRKWEEVKQAQPTRTRNH